VNPHLGDLSICRFVDLGDLAICRFGDLAIWRFGEAWRQAVSRRERNRKIGES
jgi:hypothetical protein